MSLDTRLYYSWDEAASVLGMDREGLRQHLEASFSPPPGSPSEYWLPVLIGSGNLEFLGRLLWNTSVATPAYQWNSRESFYKNCQLWDELKFSDGRALKRSEEHTSELQSLMRLTYAILCLKKKKKKS